MDLHYIYDNIQLKHHWIRLTGNEYWPVDNLHWRQSSLDNLSDYVDSQRIFA